MRISPIRNEGLCWSGTTLKRGENVGHNPPDASPSVVSPGGWAGLMPGVLPVRDVSTDEVSGVDPRPATPCGPSASASIRASTTDVLVTSRAGAAGDLLEGVDRTTGQPRWSYEVHGNRRARLVAASDDLIAFVVGDVGELVAFDATTGVERGGHPVVSIRPCPRELARVRPTPSSYGPAPGPERRSPSPPWPPQRAGNAGCAVSAHRSPGPPPPDRTSWPSNVTATGPSTPQPGSAAGRSAWSRASSACPA